MNAGPDTRSAACRGSVLMGSMLLTLIAAGTALAVLGYANQSLFLTQRSLEYQKTRAAAEAGIDYGVSRLHEILVQQGLTVDQTTLQAQLDALPPPPAFSGYVYQTPGAASAFRITVDTAVETGAVSDGDVAVGLTGERQRFTITCGVQNQALGISSVLEQEIQGLNIPMPRYGLLYQDDLEFDPGPAMSWNGRIHVNGDVYLDGPLDLHDRVTANGDIHHCRKDDGSVVGGVCIKNSADQLVSMTQALLPMDSSHADWMTQALILWNGRVLDRAHGLSYLGPAIDPASDPHDLIERGLSTGHPDYRAKTEAAKYLRRTALVLHVSSAGVFTATDFFGADVTSQFSTAVPKSNTVSDDSIPLTYNEYDRAGHGEYILDVAGSYDISKTFYDQREGATMAPLDLYLDELLTEFPQLLSAGSYSDAQGRAVIYATRDDPDGAGGLVPAVRLRNGRQLPSGGLTVASDLPVYIDGDYNEEGTPQPALVAGDAVTLLSRVWQDERSTLTATQRDATYTECRATLMTGNHPTTPGGAYNGGVENVIRLLEDWYGLTLLFRGAIHVLWDSETATGPYHSANYRSPTRDYAYDTQYLTASPPGASDAFGVEHLSWSEITWADAGW